MLYRVIISHNQPESLKKFPHLENTVVVLDAPTAMDMYECGLLGYMVCHTSSTGNRGHNRNVGLSRIMTECNPKDTDIVEFFDGDRYPRCDYSMDTVERLLQENNLDCLLYSCFGKDARYKYMSIPSNAEFIMADTSTLCNPFYSCGFAMKMSAIRKVIAENNGNFFEPRFTAWGCEDQFMGIVCSALNLNVGFTNLLSLNGDVGGDYYEHSGYRESLQVYIDLIRERGYSVKPSPVEF